jgi:hypothetical protein
VAAAFVGVEGWAGAAAAAKVECSLAPSIKANAYWGAAVGVGAAVKAGIEINAIKAARLSYLLAAAGIKAAWEGLEYMAGKVGEWLDAGAAEVVAAAGYFVDAVSDWLGSDDKAREAVAKKLHQHMDHRGRARLIDTLMSGACFNEDEDAILTIMRFAKSRNDLWLMMGRVDGGYDAILSALDGEQDTRARVIMGLS